MLAQLRPRAKTTIPIFIKRHPALAYFVLTFAISWAGVLLLVGPGGFPVASQQQFETLLPLAVVAMVLGPSITGVLLTSAFGGGYGRRELRLRLLRWRVNASWYAVALLTAPVVAMTVMLTLSRFSPDFRPGILTASNKASYLALGTAISFAAGIFEEIGWTGFAVPTLRRRYGVLGTGLVVGFLWSAWHLLVQFWATGTGFTRNVPISLFLIAGLFSTLTVFRVLMVWVYDRTASLFLVILMHTSLTASVRILNPLITGAPLLVYDLAMAGTLWIVVLVIAVANDGQLSRGSRRRSSNDDDRARNGGPLVQGTRRMHIEGFVDPAFEPVRDAFAENFSRRHELGGACCVYYHGEKVVDLWGGVRNKSTGQRWEQDTMVVVYSATKGLAAMTLALAHSRGQLDYDERVCTYWPEFAQNGKETITVRQLLAHQAGLFAFDEPVDKSAVADLDRLAVILARQKPAWEPGTRQSYHALTLGFHENELLRRIDPLHRSLGQFFQDEIATPLGLEFYIRLPESIPDMRLGTLAKPSFLRMVAGFPPRLLLNAFNRHSDIYRALVVNPGSEIVHDPDHIYVRNLEVPSGGGVGSARAIARAYGVFAYGGRELGLRRDTLEALAAPPTAPTHGFFDGGLMGDVRFSLGFMKPGPVWRFGSDVSSFGAPGSGGSLGFADPALGIGYGYVTSQMGTALAGDPRDLALRDALYSIVCRMPQPRVRVPNGAPDRPRETVRIGSPPETFASDRSEVTGDVVPRARV